ncbi:MAG: response regulator [Candidatus Lernaella stagnicola]|nr:response regulator [Candidatus Lernaella stagnicola]
MKDLSILIIEDDEVAAEILQNFVQNKFPDARVEWCWNGYEALVRVADFGPDLIFLDYMMPKIDGTLFLRDLKCLESKGACKVAIVSAYVDEDRRREFLDVGADYVVDKPIQIEEIHAILDEVVKQRA